MHVSLSFSCRLLPSMDNLTGSIYMEQFGNVNNLVRNVVMSHYVQLIVYGESLSGLIIRCEVAISSTQNPYYLAPACFVS